VACPKQLDIIIVACGICNQKLIVKLVVNMGIRYNDWKKNIIIIFMIMTLDVSYIAKSTFDWILIFYCKIFKFE
jgi:hypothetical protein